MSNKKELTQISSSEAAKMSVSALAVRPNDSSRFGQGGLSAKALQEWFDKLPNFVKDKFNEIARMLASPEAAKYIGVDALGVDNLHDFLLLFGARGTGSEDKNISDFIEVLYADINESAEQSRPLGEVVAKIVNRLALAEVHTSSEDNKYKEVNKKLDTLETVKLDRIDLLEHPDGDPTFNSSVNIGTYAAVYTEYFGIDGQWRPRLLRLNNAAYANLTDEAVEKFKNNLLAARVPMTDSVGRLSVAAPQKGAEGQYYYHNPEASAATNNTCNMAIPLWYGDERYVRSTTYTADKKATDKKISDIEGKLSGAGNESPKLYRHDICIGEYYFATMEVYFTIFNTDPTNYSVSTEFDVDAFEYNPPLTAENFAFMPKYARIHATGVSDESGDGSGDIFILAVSNTGTGIEFVVVDTGYFDICSGLTREYTYGGFEFIQDTVTEVIA